MRQIIAGLYSSHTKFTPRTLSNRPRLQAAAMALLTDTDPNTRRSAAVALRGTVADGEAQAALVALLTDTDPDTRRFAAVALRGTAADGEARGFSLFVDKSATFR